MAVKRFIEVYDLECLINLFTYTGYDVTNKQWYQFVICPWRNDTDELIKHLEKEGMIQVGYNNEDYDYPLIHHIINHKNEYTRLSGYEVSQRLYAKSQTIIEQEFSAIADRNKFIAQIDLFKIWHYNNAARKTSLKDLEIAMRMENIEEMPIHHSQWCKEGDEVLILEYNKNDVEATYRFLLTTLGKTDYSLYKGKNKIELRQNLSKKFGVNCLNLPDVRIGESLMLNLYSRAIGANSWEIRKLGTKRPFINLGDCIPKWCNIKSKEFNKFLDIVKNTTVRGEKKEFSASILFHGIFFDFGTGGAHGCIKPGIYKSDEDTMILDLDVSSLYPSVARSLNLYPEHLGPEFMRLYEQFIDARIAEKHKPKEERDNVLIEGYKLLLNGTYGKSGEETSFMFDRMYTYKTTIGGQCFICMWAERMVEACPELKFLQINTDGITIMIPRNKLEDIRRVNEQLTKETTLVIEEAFYKQMIIRDVNNYISEYDDSTPENEHLKLKGCFEIDKEYHKDPSMRVVPIALKQYYIYNIPIEETVRNHKDIFDFCLRLKTNIKSAPFYTYLDGNKIVNKRLDRTTRYYVSNTGGMLTKEFDEKRSSGVNVGYVVTLFNNFINKPMNEYNINYNFYIAETYKIKNAVDDGQLSLF
jgi:hypothetical protein